MKFIQISITQWVNVDRIIRAKIQKDGTLRLYLTEDNDDGVSGFYLDVDMEHSSHAMQLITAWGEGRR